MQTRKIAFFFAEISTIHHQSAGQVYITRSMQVCHQYFDSDMQDHLDAYGRYTYGTRNRSYILKRPNIAIVDVPFSTGHWSRFDALCKSIASTIQHNFDPFKPISHFNLDDYPEALL